MVLLSFALGCTGDQLPRPVRQRWQNLIVRQLISYAPDVICVQRCATQLKEAACSTSLSGQPAGAADGALFGVIVQALAKHGFEWCSSEPDSDGNTCAVFWRRLRWKLLSTSSVDSGGVHAVLERAPMARDSWKVSVCSLSATKPQADESNLSKTAEVLKPTLEPFAMVCGSFGSEPAKVRESLQTSLCPSFRSAHVDVLGSELPWTARSADSESCPNPDGVWLRGGSRIGVLAALGGYRSLTPPKQMATECLEQSDVPANHIPLLVVVERRPEPADGGAK